MASVHLLDKKKLSKTMRRRERGEVLEAPEIPLDLQIEIMNRLPIKSLARFMCVSKLWSSLIRSKGYFFASPPRLYISLVEQYHNCGSMVEDCHNLVLLSLSLASTNSSKSNTAFTLDMTKQGIGRYDMVALRGLILYTVCRRAYIYNPTTRQRVTLPAILDEFIRHTDQIDYFLGYDPVLDQYKVVCTVVVRLTNEISYTQHWVFVLEAGSSWKGVEFNHPHFPKRHKVFIKGVIYYLANRLMSRRIVISFDVKSEEFNMIQVPSVVYEYWYSGYLELIEYDGKPTIFDYTHLRYTSGLLNLWVLEDGGKWSNKSLVLQPYQMHLFPGNVLFQVIGTTQNGQVVLKPFRMSYPYYILYYDLHKNDVRKVDIRGISDRKWNFDLSQIDHWNFHMTLMDTGESIMPLEI